MTNADLLHRLSRLSNRAEALDIIEALTEAEMEDLLQAVAVDEAALTFLQPIWNGYAGGSKDRNEAREKCAVAIEAMAKAMAALGFRFPEIYKKDADVIRGTSRKSRHRSRDARRGPLLQAKRAGFSSCPLHPVLAAVARAGCH